MCHIYPLYIDTIGQWEQGLSVFVKVLPNVTRTCTYVLQLSPYRLRIKLRSATSVKGGHEGCHLTRHDKLPQGRDADDSGYMLSVRIIPDSSLLFYTNGGALQTTSN